MGSVDAMIVVIMKMDRTSQLGFGDRRRNLKKFGVIVNLYLFFNLRTRGRKSLVSYNQGEGTRDCGNK